MDFGATLPSLRLVDDFNRGGTGERFNEIRERGRRARRSIPVITRCVFPTRISVVFLLGDGETRDASLAPSYPAASRPRRRGRSRRRT